MITITATQDSLGTLFRTTAFSTGNPDGKTMFGYIWVFKPGVVTSSTQEIDAEFLHQGLESVGQLRDKSVMHQKATGDIFIPLSGPTRFEDINGGYIKKSTTKYRCDLLASIYHGGHDVTVFPGCVETSASTDQRIFDSAERRRYVEMRPWGDYLVSIYQVFIPKRDIYRISTGAYLSTLDPVNTCYVQIHKMVDGVPKAWGSAVQYNSYPLDTTVQAQIDSISVAGAIAYTLTGYAVTSLGTTTAAINATKEALASADFALLRQFCNQHPVDFGELAVEASKSLAYVEDNVLLIIQDLVRLKESAADLSQLLDGEEFAKVKDAFELLKTGQITLRKFREIIAPFGNVFLQWKYNYAPNLNDLNVIGQGIADAMFKDRYRRVHSRRTTQVALPDERILRHTAVFTAEVKSFGERDWGMLQELIYLGKRWGGYPGLTNLYDLLIYSFVVDWFIQLGDFFEQMDAYLDTANYFPVKYCILSEKWEYILEPGEIVPHPYEVWASGTVEFSYYNRWIQEDVPLPSIFLTANTSLSKHWAEAAFLVAQRF